MLFGLRAHTEAAGLGSSMYKLVFSTTPETGEVLSRSASTVERNLVLLHQPSHFWTSDSSYGGRYSGGLLRLDPFFSSRAQAWQPPATEPRPRAAPIPAGRGRRTGGSLPGSLPRGWGPPWPRPHVPGFQTSRGLLLAFPPPWQLRDLTASCSCTEDISGWEVLAFPAIHTESLRPAA